MFLNSFQKSQEFGVEKTLISIFLVISFFQVVDAFIAVRPLPNMFDWNNSGALVEESTGAFIFQARLWSAHDTNSLPEIED
jgi:hypothetical protein